MAYCFSEHSHPSYFMLLLILEEKKKQASFVISGNSVSLSHMLVLPHPIAV